MRTLLTLATGTFIAVMGGFTTPAQAQEASQVAIAGQTGPTLQAVSAAVRTPTVDRPLVPPQMQQGMRRSTRLMILGGGIFLAGALIGDDVGALIMIGGAATALYGLYIYLEQEPFAPPAQRFD